MGVHQFDAYAQDTKRPDFFRKKTGGLWPKDSENAVASHGVLP